MKQFTSAKYYKNVGSWCGQNFGEMHPWECRDYVFQEHSRTLPSIQDGRCIKIQEHFGDPNEPCLPIYHINKFNFAKPLTIQRSAKVLFISS